MGFCLKHLFQNLTLFHPGQNLIPDDALYVNPIFLATKQKGLTIVFFQDEVFVCVCMFVCVFVHLPLSPTSTF